MDDALQFRRQVNFAPKFGELLMLDDMPTRHEAFARNTLTDGAGGVIFIHFHVKRLSHDT